MDLLSPSSPTAWGIKPVAQDSFSPRHSWNPHRKLMSGCPHWPEISPGAKACPSPTADKSWLIRSPESVTPSLFLVPIFLGLCHQDSLPGHHLTPSQTSACSLTTPTPVTSQVTLLASALNPSVIAGPPGLCCPNSSRQKWLLPPHLTAVSSSTFPPSQNTPFTCSAKH